MEFSRQEYWSRLPFHTPGDLPDPGIEHLLCLLPWQVDSLPLPHKGTYSWAEENGAVQSDGFFLLKYGWFTMIYECQVNSKVIQFYIFFWLFSIIDYSVQFSSVTQSCLTLRPHELQQARPPCLSPTTRAHPNSCPLSRWCHPTISSSAIPFPSCPQSFPASGSFQMSQLFTSGVQSIRASDSTSDPLNEHPGLLSFRMDWLDLLEVEWTSPTPQFKSINSSALSFLYNTTLASIHDHWKNHSLD